jgi:hypothetical protein
LLPAVFGVGGGKRGIDAACGQDRVSVLLPPFCQAEHRDAALGELDRGAQPGRTGTDHQDAGRKALGSVEAGHPG